MIDPTFTGAGSNAANNTTTQATWTSWLCDNVCDNAHYVILPIVSMMIVGGAVFAARNTSPNSPEALETTNKTAVFETNAVLETTLPQSQETLQPPLQQSQETLQPPLQQSQ